MIHTGSMIKAVGLWGLLLLAACETAPPFELPNTAPVARPEQPTEPPAPEEVVRDASEASMRLGLYYRRLKNDLLEQGLLRTDGGGADAPFTDTLLARNFVRIALFDEYVTDGDILRPQATISPLRRWEQPVRMAMEFGASVPLEQRSIDRRTVGDYATRLSRLTGIPITLSDLEPNFHVIVVNEDERRDLGPRLEEIVPGIAPSSIRAITNLPREQLCIVVSLFREDSVSYAKSIAVIRGEHPDLLRTSCFHEELAQGLGLVNDSPQARPSIFNDNDEFSLLTGHDELLLQMLYDPRFTTGMSAAEAAPIARRIARELLDTGPS